MKKLYGFALMSLAVALVWGAMGCGGSKSSTKPNLKPEYSVIQTWMGTGLAALGEDGKPPLETSLYFPQDLTWGPDGLAYVADWNNHRIRRLKADGTVETIIGTGQLGDAPAGPAENISLNHPTHISFDPQGRLILSAWHNSKVMRMNLSTDWIEPICGTGGRAFGGDGGPAVDAVLNLPVDTAFDSQGRMYISDQANQRIRMVDQNGNIHTVVGNGTPGFGGDEGPAADAELHYPVGQAAWPTGKIMIDSDDNIYIPDTGNQRLRMVDNKGIIHTIAGNGTRGFAGDGGPAVDAELNNPSDVDMDQEGNIYIVDTFNHCIRKVDTNGIITTFAGQGEEHGFAGDGGSPARALLFRPAGIAFDRDDNAYIADQGNHRIRVVWKNP
jgi:sugar lactone lactonase YvrE